jgi:hypothetical protein
MQSYVNAAVLFFGFSGLKLNVDKSSVCWLQHSGNSTKILLPIAETPHVRISSQAWVPTGHRWDVQPGADLEFKRIEPHTYVTYLGSTQTHTGEYSSVLEQLRKEVKLEASLLSRKYISLGGAPYIANCVILPRILYRLKFTPASCEEIGSLHTTQTCT